MILFLVYAGRLAVVDLQLVDPEERVGDIGHRLSAAALLLQDVRRLLQAGDPVPEEQ